MKWKIVALLAALLALPAMAVEYKTIDWDVLIPAGENCCRPQVSHDGNLASVPQPVGGVNQKLDNQEVRIPGFVVPLEGMPRRSPPSCWCPTSAPASMCRPAHQSGGLRELPQGAPVDDLWDAIWVKGKMRTVSSSHEMATASYSMEAVEVSVYEEQ